jgi:hypothetical protein
MEGLPYDVPEDFKAKLPDMFDAFFIGAGNEPTPENIQAVNELREAFFIGQYKEKIYEAMYKDAETKIKKSLDEKLGNTVLPNTATASDDAGDRAGGLPGKSEFFRDLKGSPVRRI